jgi:hypothetical protein
VAISAVLAIASAYPGELDTAGLATPPTVAARGIVRPTSPAPDGWRPASPPGPQPTGSGQNTAAADVEDAQRRDPDGAGPRRPAQQNRDPGPASVRLTNGTRIGLEPANRSGYRVRHRNFAGHIDAVGPTSSSLDRADSTFTARPGLANSGCVSFESINYPGYYLRHQTFRIYLHRFDGTRLFTADATFCPVAGLTGQHSSFRSYNYPGHYLHCRGAELYITARVAADATPATMTFAVRAPFGRLTASSDQGGQADRIGR